MKPTYQLLPSGIFEIENYNASKPFSSFLPGIAGELGKPLWVFYVNRGQGICSFGVENRENMIMPFLPADQAYQQTALIGFRTFIKGTSAQHSFNYEPFHQDSHVKAIQKMRISSHHFEVEDLNKMIGLKTTVRYFTLANEPFPALMRRVSLENCSEEPLSLEIVDGLPRLMPYGMNEFFCKNMSRTSEAWMGTENLDAGIPFYKLKVLPLDEAKVLYLDKGNFVLPFQDGGLTPMIVDPTLIFGMNSSLSTPTLFYARQNFKVPTRQITDNKTPCAMTHTKFDLLPGKKKTTYMIIGQIETTETLNATVDRLSNEKYFQKKYEENKSIICDVQNNARTLTSSVAFDTYCLQNFLDNVLRGGLPITVGKEGRRRKVYYLYSRKHGDIERDYNQFVVEPSFYSQGNGNYRDVNQNRRSDIFFNPDVLEASIVSMLNLIQLDGYNPLVIKRSTFSLSAQKSAFLKRKYKRLNARKFSQLLKHTFSAGMLAQALYQEISNKSEAKVLFSKVIMQAEEHSDAEHKEGYWSDHWAYNMDLIEACLAIYPDRQKDMFLTNNSYTFYDDDVVVLPRIDRYGESEEGVPRQLRFTEKNALKIELISKRTSHPHQVRTKNGKGDVYYTTLAVKCVHIILMKSCTLDPAGLGIEMEAGKPNWYDAINGLPALFGSSTAESFELMRWVKKLHHYLLPYRSSTVLMPKEIADLMEKMMVLLKEYATTKDNLIYWHQTNDLKEKFRAQTMLGIDGEETVIKVQKILQFLLKMKERLSLSLYDSLDPKREIPFTYYKFFPEGVEIDDVNETIQVSRFKWQPLPYFLQGPVNFLKMTEYKKEALKLYKNVKESGLYDKKLKLYKVNDSLKKESYEIGRNKVFTPGWLENESIWSHMQYKYLLELLKAGIYDQFNDTFKQVLVPFQDPAVYGRSIVENSSFIASSANPDKRLHGQGFVARLSGATAEFIQLWRLLFFGENPFIVNTKGRLFLNFKPSIPAWMFTEEAQEIHYKTPQGKGMIEILPKNSVYVHFLGMIPVIMYNPTRKDSWHLSVTRMKIYPYRKKPYEIRSDRVPDAEFIRERKVEKIECYLK